MSSSSSSSAALTESFDYDLHLEGEEKPPPILSRGRMSHIYGIVLCVLLTSLLAYFRPAAVQPGKSIKSMMEIVNPEPIESAKSCTSNLHLIDDMNAQIISRINALNDTVSTLRSRVFEIESKPVVTITDNFAVKKIKIEGNMVFISKKVNSQRNELERLMEVQRMTKSDLDMMREVGSERSTKISSVTSDIQDRLSKLNSLIHSATLKNEETAILMIEKLKKPQLKTVIKSPEKMPHIAPDNTLLLEKITILEKRFMSALQRASGTLSIPEGNQNHTTIPEEAAFESVGKIKYSKRFVEAIVKENWEKNLESYKSLVPTPVCQKEKVVSKIIIKEVIVEKILEPVVPAAAPADFARRQAGAQIVHIGTSVTYTPPEMNFKHLFSNLFDYIGVNTNSFMMVNPIATGITCAADAIVPSAFHFLGLDFGIGRPEDALSSDMSLGSCWPMLGTYGIMTIKLSRPVMIESISIDHIARDDSVDLRSAPRDFKVYGSGYLAEDISDFNYLAEGSYNVSAQYNPTQNFPTKRAPEPSQYVALKILSNHGHSDYTCLYRLRVHGKPV